MYALIGKLGRTDRQTVRQTNKQTNKNFVNKHILQMDVCIHRCDGLDPQSDISVHMCVGMPIYIYI